MAITLDRAVSLKDLTQHPVLADLAGLVDGRSERASGLLQSLLEPDGGQDAALVCFPYAGGNAVNFQSMARALRGSGLAVYAAELPGHDLAAENEPFAPMAQVVEQACAEITRLQVPRVLLWGHSSGAAFALATAAKLGEAGVNIQRVFVAAQLPGDAADRRASITDLTGRSDAEIAAELTTVTGAELTTVTGAELTTVTGAELTTVTGAELTTVTGAELTTVTGAELTTVTGAELTTVTGAELTTVTGAELTTVTGAELTTVTGAELTTVTGAELTTVTGTAEFRAELGELDGPRVEQIGAAYRHDCVSAHRWIADALDRPPAVKLSAPVTVVVAADDPYTAGSRHRYREWQLLADQVNLHELADGGHYFLRTRPAQAAQAVLRADGWSASS